MFVLAVHVTANYRVLPFLKLRKHEYICLSFHLFLETCYFQILVIMNSTVIHVGVQIYFQNNVFKLLE